MATARQALQQLHEMGAKTVVISSTELGTEDRLVALGSSRESTSKVLVYTDLWSIYGLIYIGSMLYDQ